MPRISRAAAVGFPHHVTQKLLKKGIIRNVFLKIRVYCPISKD